MYTGNRHYVTWAQSVLSWINTSLRSPDGLFWDHINLQGGVDHAEWSLHNQGLMIGANTLMYMATRGSGR